MQCASSMAKNEIGTRFSQSIVSARASRSGERYSSRYSPFAGVAHHLGLLLLGDRAVQQRRAEFPFARAAPPDPASARSAAKPRPPFAPRAARRQLITQRLAAARRHHDASIATSQQAAHNAFLQRTERAISPVAAQRCENIFLRNHLKQYKSPRVSRRCPRHIHPDKKIFADAKNGLELSDVGQSASGAVEIRDCHSSRTLARHSAAFSRSHGGNICAFRLLRLGGGVAPMAAPPRVVASGFCDWLRRDDGRLRRFIVPQRTSRPVIIG